MFNTVKLKFRDREDTNLYNISAGHLFKDNVNHLVRSCN